ncbi:MAG: N-acetylornithine carbamoyltransferase [bacterium]|nr:N-acetylornithine carbamoyltransferase [bacterium]
MKATKHFYNTADFSLREILNLIDSALQMKRGKYKKTLSGKSLAMLFFNPSLRTRVSFTMAMRKLGGDVLPLDVKDTFTFEFADNVIMNTATQEHVKEAARLLSRYCDSLAIRSSELITTSLASAEVSDWKTLKQDIVIRKFMEYATVPVINMESNVYHPAQGLGDAMTIKEKLGNPKGRKYVLTWTYHPKALPMAVTNSQLLAACDLGMDVVVAHPKGWELDEEIVKLMDERSKGAKGSISFSNNMEKAMKDADIVTSKSWGALKYYGNSQKEKTIKEGLKHWIVDKKKMSKTANALYMHCLPVRRNVEVTDEVIDSKNSIVIDQAENRMWAQMALLDYLIGKKQ